MRVLSWGKGGRVLGEVEDDGESDEMKLSGDELMN